MSDIRIRMYRVGFGDFFLLTFDGDKHVIVDCGVFKGTSSTGDVGSLEAAIEDMIAVTRGKIALIVVTHRHADHIAGFGRFAARFAESLEVESIFMPIWETEYDDTAKKFQAELTSLAEQLQDHLDLRLAAGKDVGTALYHRIGNATGREPPVLGAAGNTAPKKQASKNKMALELLKTGFKGIKPQYLASGDTPKLPKSLRDAGVRIEVLGPPPVDKLDLMKLMDLKTGVGQFLAMAGAAPDGELPEDAPPSAWEPFGPSWRAPRDSISPWGFVDWMPRRGAELRACHGDKAQEDAVTTPAREQFEALLGRSTPEALAIAAKKLDGFLNNQSLVLLFSYGGRNLLFAGDAQAGNWEHWLFDTDEPDKEGDLPLSKRAKEILESVDVYKVGHHGSTNSTPKVVAKTLRKNAVCLCSTEAEVYGESHGTAVPLAKLMTALRADRRLVRSDALSIEVGGKTVKTHARLPEDDTGLAPGAVWIDYTLEAD